MKTMTYLLLLSCLITGLALRAAESPTSAPTNEAPSAPATNILAATDQPPPAPTPPAETVTNAVNPTAASAAVCVTNTVAGTNAPLGTNALAAAAPAEPPVVIDNGTNGLRLNFHNAPLNLVLDYLSDAAGFIINREADVKGTVDVQGKNLTKDEAVAVLNSSLKRNGYAIARNGRILTIIAQDTAKTGDLPIEVGPADPDGVDKGSEMVTRIIPVKYASVSQLVPNLELLLPNTATLSANESANSLILVATKTDVKRMLTIINALDTSIASVSSIKVIPLRYADAKDTATLISTLFASQSAGATANNSGRPSFFSMFGGRGGFGGPASFGGGRGSSGGPGGGGTGSGGGAAAKNVVAVGDDRSNSIIISAPADLLTTIEGTVKEIDQEVTDVTELRVFRLLNADPSETSDQLAQLFPDPTSTNGNNNQGQTPFFFSSRFSRRTSTTPTTGDSDRSKKMGRVLAVPDPRTSAVIVMASKTLMPQIADMISELDSDKGRKEVVGYFDLQNADPQDVQNALQDLFNRNTRMNNNNNQNTMLGQNSPLNKRITQNSQVSGNRSSGFGGTGSGRSSGSPTGN
jgi:type II secretory pathway component GspD/PulD (secretin)